MSARTDLVDILETAFDGIANVYQSPADIIATPAVVLTPADPYQSPASFQSSGPGLSILWNFEVVLAVPRATVSDGLTTLEGLAVTLRAAIKGSGFRYIETRGLETITVADTDYFGLRVAVDRMATD